MAVFFTDETALEFWDHSRSKGSLRVMPKGSRLSRIPDKAPSPSEAMSVCMDLMPVREPLHVMTVNGDGNRRSDAVKYSSFSRDLPKGSFARVGNGVYVATPEFAFVRMARKLGFAELVYLGCELAATYARTVVDEDFDTSGFHACEPRTSQAALLRFISSAGDIHGIKAAKVAAKHVVDGAASPMEAELAIALTLPKMRGGYALPRPCLNYELPLSFEESLRLKRNSIIVDAAWPEKKLALEYDSDMWHTGSEKIAQDSIRRNDIALLGYTVRTVTHKEIGSISSMDKIAESLTRELGVRARKGPDDYPNKKVRLQRELKTFRDKGIY